MAGLKNQTKAERERAVFELFSRSQGVWSEASVSESRPPPEPDILFTPAGESPVAFEMVEFIDRDFARTTASDRSTEAQMRAAYNELALPEREKLGARFSNADITIAFEYGVTERNRAKALKALFFYLAALPPGWSGVKPRPVELHPYVTEVFVNRGNFTGPLFAVASATWVEDPCTAAVEEKVNSTYKTPHPIELLAYIESNPMFPEDAWVGDLSAFCKALTTNPFRAIYVFDVTKKVVLFCWPPGACR